MQSGQLVEVEPGVQRRVAWETTPIKDVMFMKIDEMLRNCKGNCSLCPDFRMCLSNHDKVSSLSALSKLSQSRLLTYQSKFQKLIKSEKAEPLFVFFIIGAIICGGCYGVSLPLSWLGHSFFS